MKTLKVNFGVLSKTTLSLSFILPLIGVAELNSGDYPSAAGVFTQSAQPKIDPELAKTLKAMTAARAGYEEIKKYNSLHERNTGLIKAQQSVRQRAQDEITNAQTQMENLKQGATNTNTSGIDNGIAAFQSELNAGNLPKECRNNVDASGLQAIPQQLKNFYNQLTSNLSNQADKKLDDIETKALKLSTEELSRQEALERKNNPDREKFEKSSAELTDAYKNPEAFIKFLKDRSENLNQDVKENTAILRKMLYNPDGLTNLLAKVEKDKQLLIQVGSQLAGMVRNTITQLQVESDKQLANLRDNCDYNRNEVLTLKSQVLPAMEQALQNATAANDQANMATISKNLRKVRNNIAKADKADCSMNTDLQTAFAQLSNVEQNIITAANSGNALQLFTAFNQATVQTGDMMRVVSQEVRPLKQDCKTNANLMTALKNDAVVQEVRQAARSGQDVNQALAGATGSAPQGAATSTPVRSSVPALNNPVTALPRG